MVQLDDATINQVGTAWAIGELALWAPRARYLVAGISLVTVAYVVCDLPQQAGQIMPSLVGLAINLGLPTLLGLVVRTTRELGLRAEQQTLSEQRAARADERSAIARELHDVVAHHVASMVLRVGVAQHVLPDVDPRVADVFDDVHRTGTAALADLRRLVDVLRDPDRVRGDAALTAIDPTALPAALDGAVETARRAGVIVEADLDPAIITLDAVRGLALLRLTQEGLTNVAKHAGPEARASLHVAMEGTDLHWSVTDDGGHFPASTSQPPAPGPASSPGARPPSGPSPAAASTSAPSSAPAAASSSAPSLAPAAGSSSASGLASAVSSESASGSASAVSSESALGSRPAFGSATASGPVPASGSRPAFGTVPASGSRPAFGSRPASGPSRASGSRPVPGGGHGLTGMRERVEVLGGSLTAGPHGPGWRVATVLPASLPLPISEESR